MKFSIIVPVYNVEDKVAKCLSSIEDQSYQDYEVIIVIDGSTDGSKQICNQFAQRNDKFKVIYKTNGGLVSARKRGSEIACGDYILNIDSDDYVDENYLQEINKIICHYHPDMIACGYKMVSNSIIEYQNNAPCGMYDKISISKMKESIIYDKNRKGYQGGALANSIWSKIVKREIYQKCQCLVPDHITIGEDLLLNSYLIDKAESLYITDKTFYYYVIHASSMMQKPNPDNFQHFLDVSIELKKTKYINSNDIHVYLFQWFFYEIVKLSRSCANYENFKHIIQEKEAIQEMKNHAKEAVFTKINTEARLMRFIIKYLNWNLIYYVCKYFSIEKIKKLFIRY